MLVERELVELGREGLLELPMSSRGESAEVTEGRRDPDTLLVERTDDPERMRVELEAAAKAMLLTRPEWGATRVRGDVAALLAPG